MFVPLWAIFLVTGLTMAVITVIWAIRTRQFEEQQRARFIPLAGISDEELRARPVRRHRAEKLGFGALLLVGASAIGACLLLTVL
ncbi:MAG: hypothetical protein JRF63_05860 [Deltaproteobacteria bacterium]|nr:hypothetical protein [Deltaproteobacteria bacterium]